MLAIVFCLSSLLAFSLQAQTSITSKMVLERMGAQVSIYPQEKLYLHLDRTSFFQGEKIWFKAYLTDAFLHSSEAGSRYVYVELINPADSVVERVMIRPENDLFYGHCPIAEDLAEGTYTLRAYTRYMENMGEDSYFRRKIEVSSVIASQIRPHYTLDYLPEERKVHIDLYYTAGYSDEKIKPDKLMILNRRGEMRPVRMEKDTVARFAYELPKKGEPQHAIYLEVDNFSHYIPLPTADEDYEVTFYPEGGYLINGALTRVAFKAVNAAGLPEEITGTIYNDKGEGGTEIQTLHNGMGLFGLIAGEKDSYYLECVNSKNQKKRFDLPKGVSGVYGIQANGRGGNLFVHLVAPGDKPVKDNLYILIHQNGEVYFFDSYSPKRKEMVFPWDILPQGILQVMLLDKDLNPLSERLVFSPVRDEPVLRMNADKAAYAIREKISMELDLRDEKGAPLKGNLSVAITDSRDVEIDSLHTIASTLLLTSELKGYIEDPAYYFRSDETKAVYALDLLLMTQGWRRYDVAQALKGNYTYPMIRPEMGMALTGTVTQIESNKPIAKGEVTLMLTDQEGGSFIDQTFTNEKGQFVFPGMEYSDSTKLFMQSLNFKGKNHVQLNMDKITYPFAGALDRALRQLPPETIEEDISFEEEEDLNLILKKAEERAKYDENMQVVNLKEIMVTALKVEKDPGPERSVYASKFTTVVDFEEKMETRNYSSVADLFYEIPGVQVVTDEFDNKHLIIRGVGSINSGIFATILVDGIPTNDPEIFKTINVHDVASVEVYKGADAAIFGLLGGNGVVNILYKKGGNVKTLPDFNKVSTTLLGFQRPVEFYAPKYETPQQKSSYLPDLRTTIYWKPDLLTDEDGKARLEFYSADSPTVYDVVFEGLTTDGIPVRKTEKIRIE
ncbi:TonB-dependent receptor plug domain-containing protein [Parabacteroides sp. PF5-6]|uniref:carboxypeptidase-like regulatory domain-containing protein n=1 Tax=Parabacteroides sp. PF5-6 TaxID=1742403 RepID=UPI0024062044|nr:TonB-dependent receptor plug domain-containing protein [Parabacteroides sp. PF5-6]MDF9831297.1 hypothetical protein [Parabacteroides sp. PF5-6]